MDIYLINLDRRPDRLSNVSRQLDKTGLPFDRFAAIDAQSDEADLPHVRRELFTISYKRNPMRGEISCAATHIAVWKRFLDAEEEYAIILEDDVDIHHDLVLLQGHIPALELDFINISSNAPYKLDRATLEDVYARGKLDRPRRFQKTERRRWKNLEWRRRRRIFRLLPLSAGDVACECDPAPALTSGCIVYRRAARAFLTTIKQIFFPIDLAAIFFGHAASRVSCDARSDANQ